MPLAVGGLERFVVDGLAVELHLEVTVGLAAASSELGAVRARGFSDKDRGDNVDLLALVEVVVGVDRDAEGGFAINGGAQLAAHSRLVYCGILDRLYNLHSRLALNLDDLGIFADGRVLQIGLDDGRGGCRY